MKILVYVEGDSDRGVLEPMVRSAVGKAHGVKFFPVGGKGELLKRVPGTAREHLAQHPEDWVFVLPDLYPVERERSATFHHTDADALRAVLRREFGNHPQLGRFRPHALVHDLEVLLLAAPEPLRRVLGTKEHPKWRLPPETQNNEKPPKNVIRELFRRYKGRDYRESGDAEQVLRGVDPSALAQACPEGFGRFWRELNQVARGVHPDEADSAGRGAR